MRREHQVPLPRQALVILEGLKEITGGGRLVFPGIRSIERPISENTLNASMRRMGFKQDEVSAHGFRATAHRPCPTLEQIRAVLGAMPTETEIQRRDRALVAFAILTGARDSAIVSFKLKHIDLERELLEQDARDVATKRANTFSTWFFPVGDSIKQIVVDWIGFLRQEKHFGPNDPIFPKSGVEPGPNLHFVAVGLDRAHWANAHPVRALFKEAFARVGLPYFNPHSFRSTLVLLAYELKADAEQFKAWSQNLGHEHCLTTFSSYGNLPPHRQAEIIRGLAKPTLLGSEDPAPDLLRQLADGAAQKVRLLIG